MGGAFYLWGPENIQTGYSNHALAGGAGVGVLLYEDFYAGVRGVFGEFERIEKSSREETCTSSPEKR